MMKELMLIIDLSRLGGTSRGSKMNKIIVFECKQVSYKFSNKSCSVKMQTVK